MPTPDGPSLRSRRLLSQVARGTARAVFGASRRERVPGARAAGLLRRGSLTFSDFDDELRPSMSATSPAPRGPSAILQPSGRRHRGLRTVSTHGAVSCSAAGEIAQELRGVVAWNSRAWRVG